MAGGQSGPGTLSCLPDTDRWHTNKPPCALNACREALIFRAQCPTSVLFPETYFEPENLKLACKVVLFEIFLYYSTKTVQVIFTALSTPLHPYCYTGWRLCFLPSALYAPSCCHKYSPEKQIWINPRMKIVPKKHTIYSRWLWLGKRFVLPLLVFLTQSYTWFFLLNQFSIYIY